MKRALLLEDEDACRNILIQAFEDYDIHVDAYQDPTCFLKNFEKCPVSKSCFDFILTDNQMPHMTGLDFLQVLEEIECIIPVQNRAIISGNLSQSDFIRIKQLGVKYFYKPCPISEIYKWLDGLGIISL